MCLIALGLLLDPQIVILDEPTTAVDILTQRTIIDVLLAIKKELNFSIVFISHDLSVAAEMADTVATMYAGEIVEIGPVNEIFYRPASRLHVGPARSDPTSQRRGGRVNQHPRQPARFDRAAVRLQVSCALPVYDGAVCANTAAVGVSG